MSEMNGRQYLETQMRLIEIGKIADTLDLKAFLQCIKNAEALGPVLDPTQYRKAIDNLEAIKKLAESVLPVKTAFEETFKVILNTAIRESGMVTKVAGYMGNINPPGCEPDVP